MKTEYIEIRDCAAQAADIRRAADTIRRGGLVVFPTETVYGLGGNATDAEAATRIYAAKGRPSDNPLIIHIASPEEAERYTVTNATYYRLAAAFMPGPLTVILPARDTVPERTRGSLPTVAVRCPSHPVAQALIRAAGVPIAAPSANLSGSPSPTTARHAADDMMGRVDMILDGGDCDFGLESTIVKPEEDGSVTLLRPGRITPDMLRAAVGDVHVAPAVTDRLREGEVALSPGMKYRHYAPQAPVFLLDGSCTDAVAWIRERGRSHVAVLAYRDDMPALQAALPAATCYDFGARADTAQQAHLLFSLLREADKEGYEEIYAPLPPTDGVGLALYNRMIRAAAYQIIRLRR